MPDRTVILLTFMQGRRRVVDGRGLKVGGTCENYPGSLPQATALIAKGVNFHTSGGERERTRKYPPYPLASFYAYSLPFSQPQLVWLYIRFLYPLSLRLFLTMSLVSSLLLPSVSQIGVVTPCQPFSSLHLECHLKSAHGETGASNACFKEGLHHLPFICY